MRITRRRCLAAGAVAAGGAALSGCGHLITHFTTPGIPNSIELPGVHTDEIARLVNRVSFGPMPGELWHVAEMGAEAYIDAQLGVGADDPPLLRWMLHGNEALNADPSELRDVHQSEVLTELEEAQLIRAIYSPHQLYERMADFWTNHFNIFAHKAAGVYLKSRDDLNVIRPHALGQFSDMLNASAHSPAMLGYLDNQVNVKGQPNENYAREIMELHTLGVHGGYTQRDIMEVARCFTGWTVENRIYHRRAQFRFDPARHDFDRKTVLGHIIPAGGGVEDGERVLNILAHHPSTAGFVAGKLIGHFVGGPQPALQQQMATVFLTTRGDIRKTLRPLLLSRQLVTGPPIIKRPLDYVVSSLRALNAVTNAGPHLQYHLAQMGQPLNLWPMPDGYPDKTTSWTGSLLARWNFGNALASGAIQGTQIPTRKLVQVSGAITPAQTADAVIGIVVGRKVDSPSLVRLRKTIQAGLRNAGPSAGDAGLNRAVALALASPDFQWR